MKVTINGAEKEITISNVYTRKIDREYNDILLDWLKATPQQLQAGEIEIAISNGQKANDYLIVAMTNLTAEEVDWLTVEDYEKVLEAVERQKYPVRNNAILEQFAKTLRSWKWLSKEHRDYILIKELYHCKPSDLDNESEHVLNLHFAMIQEERKREHIQSEREKQKSKVSSHKK